MEDQLILNRYRPINEAGSGGFATVQLAWDTRIQRRVAIKCIQLKEEELDQAVIPGLDEARTAAMLTDGSIVGVYDFEVQGNMAFLIMEYVDGMTLTELLAEYGEDLSLDVIAAVFSSVAHALEIAHDNQVLHLDIKPDNILINRQGQVKVTDFGLATLSDAAGFGAATGGTIGYMPPEQMRREALDGRCDEWALASVTYEMLVDENPFFAPDLASAEAVIEQAEIAVPSLCRNDLDAAADDILFAALDPDREGRFDRVTEFAEEMEQFLGNPVKGQRELAVLVGEACEDFEEEEELLERISFFDRLDERNVRIFGRVWSVLNAIILSFVAFNNITFSEGITNPILWGGVALFAVAAAFKPHLGALLSLLVLALSLLFNEAFLVGILLIVVACAWWFFVGRWGDNQSNTALTPAFFGGFSFNQLSPLVIGFTLNAKDTLINTLMALLLSVILAGFGSLSLLGWNVIAVWDYSAADVQANILLLLGKPSTWILAVGWVAAALIMRAFCLRQTRLFAFLGVISALIILCASLSIGSWVESGTWMPEWFALLSTGAAGVVMSIMCAFGVPIRTSDLINEED